MLTIPNLLSVVRLALAPVLLYLAWNGYAALFVGVLLLAAMTDAVDGMIARRFHQLSPIGPTLDSLADGVIYLTLVPAAWWLWPDVVVREWPWIGVLLACIGLHTVIGLAKFGTLPSYHTWWVKGSVAVTWIATLQMLIGGPSWPFHLAVVCCAGAAAELISITLLLDEPRSDVGSVVHLLAGRRGGA